MDFGYAISNIKNGYRLARRGWNGRGIFIQLQSPYMESDMTYPYIYKRRQLRKRVTLVTR